MGIGGFIFNSSEFAEQQRANLEASPYLKAKSFMGVLRI
jgi:hypothetical protein